MLGLPIWGLLMCAANVIVSAVIITLMSRHISEILANHSMPDWLRMGIHIAIITVLALGVGTITGIALIDLSNPIGDVQITPSIDTGTIYYNI